jgi:hypothetical protein
MVNMLKLSSKYYDLHAYLFGYVTARFVRQHTLNAFDFYAIITWKSNRSISKVKNGLRSAKLTPRAFMSKIAACSSDQERMRELVKVTGIGVPIASAILTVCYPKKFTILDYRAWEALFHFKMVFSQTMPTDIGSYFDIYLPACRAMAIQQNMTLRDLDGAMWGWSKYRSIVQWSGNAKSVV